MQRAYAQQVNLPDKPQYNLQESLKERTNASMEMLSSYRLLSQEVRCRRHLILGLYSQTTCHTISTIMFIFNTSLNMIGVQFDTLCNLIGCLYANDTLYISLHILALLYCMPLLENSFVLSSWSGWRPRSPVVRATWYKRAVMMMSLCKDSNTLPIFLLLERIQVKYENTSIA